MDDVLQVGQQVEVEIAEIGDRGKLSLHAVIDGEAGELEATEGEQTEQRRDRSERRERRPRTRTRRRRDDEREEGASEE